MKRQRVNKAKSAKQFRHNVGRTKAANINWGGGSTYANGPMRGGWRL